MVLICTNAGKTQQRRQLSAKALVTVVAASLDTQGTGPVILLGEAIIQCFVPGLQPHLIALGILGRCNLKLSQGRDVIVGQFPGFIGVEVRLGAR